MLRKPRINLAGYQCVNHVGEWFSNFNLKDKIRYNILNLIFKWAKVVFQRQTRMVYKPDYEVCYFVFEKEEAGFYIGLSSNGKEIKIKKEKGINLLTWSKFLTDEVTGITEEHTIEYMYKEPNKQSEKTKIKDFDKSEILEVKGFWMKIKNKNDIGWIEWRDEKKLLMFISLLC